MTYILSLDAGTTSNRAIVFDLTGRQCANASIPLEQHYPQSGWVEHDPVDILDGITASVSEAVSSAGLSLTDIACLGITNQRETTLLWERATGKPLHNAIVWQDRRTQPLCQTLKEQGWEPRFQARSGLLLDPYFSGTKLAWLLDTYDPDRSRARAGELCFGTVDSWLLWNLAGEHKIEATNASRTLMYNLHTGAWDAELCEALNVPMAVLPDICESAGQLAVTGAHFGAEIPITGIAGDQQSALVGQACIAPGMVKSTYGTGCFLMAHAGGKPPVSENRLLSTLAYAVKGERQFALEGAIFNVGTTIQWLRDELKLFREASETGDMAAAATDEDVQIVPAFTGLGAPWWDSEARGLIANLTRNTGPNDLVRAALDAACHQTQDLVRVIAADGQPCQSIRVDGGMVANDWLCQRLSDMTGLTIERPEIAESTAFGAAMLAAVGAGLVDSLEDVVALWRLDRRFEPEALPEWREEQAERWHAAVSRALTR